MQALFPSVTIFIVPKSEVLLQVAKQDLGRLRENAKAFVEATVTERNEETFSSKMKTAPVIFIKSVLFTILNPARLQVVPMP